MSDETRPCMGAGCGRTDGTHGEECYQNPAKIKKIRDYWTKKNSYNDLLVKFCKDRKLQFKTHDSHGFYLDVWVAGHKFMVDPTPDEFKGWTPADLVRIRDESHHYEKPTMICDVFLDQEGWQDALANVLSIAVIGS